MNELEVWFFPATKTGTNYLGGGYIKDSVFSVSFSVFKNKQGNDFIIALPSRKTEDGEYINLAEFRSKEISDKARNLVKEKLINNGIKLSSFVTNESHTVESVKKNDEKKNKTVRREVPF